jgi:hypothetical protein
VANADQITRIQSCNKQFADTVKINKLKVKESEVAKHKVMVESKCSGNVNKTL